MPEAPGEVAVIGITTSFTDGEQRLRHAYVRAVERVGGVPVIVPVLQNQATIDTLLQLLDGLIVTGGPAVTMGMVGDLPADLEDADPLRLASDVSLLKAFLRMDRPVLGICYGMQLLNALDGGTIYADVERQKSGALVHSALRGATSHSVTLEAGSTLARNLGKTTIHVNSRHIQAIAEVGPSYRAIGFAPDGVVEAIERTGGRVLGVQFHPERMDEMVPLFRYFTHAASGDLKKDGTQQPLRG